MKHVTWGLVMATGRAEKISSAIETPFLYLNDRPVLAYSLAAFMQCAEIEGIIVVIPRERAESVLGLVQMLGLSKVKKIVVGGTRRSVAMALGLEHMHDDVKWVCVHDASRPMVTPAQITETVKCAWRNGSGVMTTEIGDPVVAANRNRIESRMDGRAWAIISPQAYSREVLDTVYPQIAKNRKNHADDLEAVMSVGVEPRLIPSATVSLRIQSADDLAPALALMK